MEYKKRLMIYLVVGLMMILTFTDMSVNAANFQPVVIQTNHSFYNVSIMVCSTNTDVCSDVWMENFTSETNRTTAVVVLEGYNSTYDGNYYFSAYLDGILEFNNTRSYLGRGIINVSSYNDINIWGSLVIANDTANSAASGVTSLWGSLTTANTTANNALPASDQRYNDSILISSEIGKVIDNTSNFDVGKLNGLSAAQINASSIAAGIAYADLVNATTWTNFATWTALVTTNDTANNALVASDQRYNDTLYVNSQVGSIIDNTSNFDVGTLNGLTAAEINDSAILAVGTLFNDTGLILVVNTSAWSSFATWISLSTTNDSVNALWGSLTTANTTANNALPASDQRYNETAYINSQISGVIDNTSNFDVGLLNGLTAAQINSSTIAWVEEQGYETGAYDDTALWTNASDQYALINTKLDTSDERYNETEYIITNYVPYTGASNEVNLGANNLITTGTITSGPISLDGGTSIISTDNPFSLVIGGMTIMDNDIYGGDVRTDGCSLSGGNFKVNFEGDGLWTSAIDLDMSNNGILCNSITVIDGIISGNGSGITDIQYDASAYNETLLITSEIGLIIGNTTNFDAGKLNGLTASQINSSAITASKEYANLVNTSAIAHAKTYSDLVNATAWTNHATWTALTTTNNTANNAAVALGNNATLINLINANYQNKSAVINNERFFGKNITLTNGSTLQLEIYPQQVLGVEEFMLRSVVAPAVAITSTNTARARLDIMHTADTGGDAVLRLIPDNDSLAYITLSATGVGGGLILNSLNESDRMLNPATDNAFSLGSPTYRWGALYATNITATNINYNLRKSVYIPAKEMSPTTTAGCAALTQYETTTYDVNYWGMAFDGSTDENAFFVMTMPKSWDLCAGAIGNDISFYVDYIPTGTTGGTGIAWYVTALSVGDNENPDAAFSSASQTVDTIQTANYVHHTAESNPITPAGTLGGDNVIFFKVTRNADFGADSNTNDAVLLGITMKYNVLKESDA